MCGRDLVSLTAWAAVDVHASATQTQLLLAELPSTLIYVTQKPPQWQVPRPCNEFIRSIFAYCLNGIPGPHAIEQCKLDLALWLRDGACSGSRPWGSTGEMSIPRHWDDWSENQRRRQLVNGESAPRSSAGGATITCKSRSLGMRQIVGHGSESGNSRCWATPRCMRRLEAGQRRDHDGAMTWCATRTRDGGEIHNEVTRHLEKQPIQQQIQSKTTVGGHFTREMMLRVMPGILKSGSKLYLGPEDFILLWLTIWTSLDFRTGPKPIRPSLLCLFIIQGPRVPSPSTAVQIRERSWPR
jgi:hypothetical protein